MQRAACVFASQQPGVDGPAADREALKSVSLLSGTLSHGRDPVAALAFARVGRRLRWASKTASVDIAATGVAAMTYRKLQRHISSTTNDCFGFSVVDRGETSIEACQENRFTRSSNERYSRNMSGRW